MSLTENGGNGMVMPVSPMYGGSNGGWGGFGGDGWWVILFLFALMGNGWGGFGGFGGGYGNYAIGSEIYPWMNQANLTSNGFQNQLINDNITEIRSGVSNLATQLCNLTGQIQNSLCNGFAGVNATITGGFADAEIANNARQMANMQQAFNAQTATSQGFNQLGSQLAQCCCDNRLATNDLKYTISTENCADRAALSDGIRDLLTNQTANTQRILDQLCQDKIDAKNEKIADLERQLSMATLRESQTAQNAFIQQGFSDEVDQLYNRLNNCPVPTTPVYGRTPIFTCNGGCGCGNAAAF